MLKKKQPTPHSNSQHYLPFTPLPNSHLYNLFTPLPTIRNSTNHSHPYHTSTPLTNLPPINVSALILTSTPHSYLYYPCTPLPPFTPLPSFTSVPPIHNSTSHAQFYNPFIPLLAFHTSNLHSHLYHPCTPIPLIHTSIPHSLPHIVTSTRHSLLRHSHF